MPVQAVALVLGQYRDLPVAAVDQVGQGKVDQAVVPGERDGGLGSIGSQWRKPLAFAPR